MPKGIYKHRPLTEEQKLKISIALKGKKKLPLTEEHKRKLSEARKGKCLGENNPAKRLEVRKKISAWHKGKHLSEEHKRKIGKSKKGNERQSIYEGKTLETFR